MAGRADADVVASHLLECGPQADPEVSELLVRAAADAARRGAPHAAAAYLERALEERAPGDDRGRMLAQLATVAFDAGLPDSRRRLREALHEVRDRESRIDVLTRLAALNVVDTGDAEPAELFERELAGETDPDVRLAIEAASLDALMMIPERHAERARRVAAIDLRRDDGPAARARRPRAPRVGRDRARRARRGRRARRWRAEALEGDLLLREAGRRAAYHLCVRALVMTDRPTRRGRRSRACATRRSRAARCGCAPARPGTRRTSRCAAGASPRPRTTPAWRSTSSTTASTSSPAAPLEVLVCALAERGAFGEARELLRERRLDGALRATRWEIGMRHARARLWLAEGDFERAHAEALRGRRAARAAGPAEPELDAVALDRRAGARPPRPPRGGRRRWPTPSWRWPSASARRCRSPARCTRAPSPRPTTTRASRCCERALSVVAGVPAALERGARCGSSSAARWPTWAGASRRATRCARRWPTPTRSARCCWPSAPGASSWRPGCARARRRSRAPRR